MNISIYSFWFEPDKDVGARRWTIFANELAKRGHHVTVTTVNATIKKKNYQSNSESDTLQFRDISIPRFPNSFGKSLLSKILWHGTKMWYELIYKGWFWDPTISLRGEISRLVSLDVENESDVVVVTCAPFRWSLYLGQELAKYSAKPKLFIDLRDPWSKNELTYFTNLSSRRLSDEAYIESKAIGHANGVIVAHEPMRQHYPGKQTLFLPNNFEIPKGTWQRKEIQNELIFIFPGTLYNDGHDYLIDFINKVKYCFPNIRIILKLIGNWDQSLIEKVERFCSVEYLGYVKKSSVKPLITSSHFVITYISPKLPYAINTKILEAVESRVPLFLIGESHIQDFVGRNKIGWIAEPNLEAEKLRECILYEGPYGPFMDNEFGTKNGVDYLVNFLRNTECNS